MDIDMDEFMGILEKIKTLLRSRRLWMLLAQAVIAVLLIAGMFVPLLGLDAPDVPDEDALTDRLAAAGERIAAVIGAVLTIISFFASARQTSADYTLRPPGVKDRTGIEAQLE